MIGARRDAAACDISVRSVGVEHVTAAGVVRALDEVSFDVPAGSAVAVVGPSGCGKSTLLGVLAALAVPTAGRVEIGGRSLSAMTDRQRTTFRRSHLGLIYQADNLLPFLTVAENVALQSAWPGGPSGAEGGTDAVLADLGLAEEADKLPDQLSGGQRQRAAVARAVVHRPAVILADEPTGALDADNAAIVIDLLLGARDDLDCTLVLVTHDPQWARRMDRVISLRDGRLVDDREPVG